MISDTVEFSGAEEATLNLASLLSRQEDVEVQLCSTRFTDSMVQELPFERSLRIDRQKPKRIEELYSSLAHPRTPAPAADPTELPARRSVLRALLAVACQRPAYSEALVTPLGQPSQPV